jgi:cell division protease FtsH
VNLEELARGTPGFSGADLANLVNEAALAAARQGKKQVDRRDFQEALDKLLLGGKREALMDERERRIVAYHEGGHALVAAVLPDVDPLYKVTIVPRGRSLGVTQFLPEDDRRNYPRSYLLERLAQKLLQEEVLERDQVLTIIASARTAQTAQMGAGGSESAEGKPTVGLEH